MRDILGDIFTWSRLSEPHGYDFNGHLICHADGNLCIDPVEPDAAAAEEIERLGVARILLTRGGRWRRRKACAPWRAGARTWAST